MHKYIYYTCTRHSVHCTKRYNKVPVLQGIAVFLLIVEHQQWRNAVITHIQGWGGVGWGGVGGLCPVRQDRKVRNRSM